MAREFTAEKEFTVEREFITETCQDGRYMFAKLPWMINYYMNQCSAI